jgi:peptidoglycan/xylan/chitin deacetylase (PgdA/CDA1 family)
MRALTPLGVLLLTWSSMIGLNYAAEVKQVAITIDDLPFVGSANNHPGKLRRERERFIKIMETLKAKNAPATGFVVAGTIEKGQWELLETFAKEGFSIGNHTYTHPSLNRVSAERYKQNISKADEKLKPLMTNPKYFRYPYLAESRGQKNQEVLDYLTQLNYIVAPVTIDSKDFRFNTRLFRIPYRQRPARVGGLTRQYVDYIWRQTQRAERISAKKGEPNEHILLIHANLINAHAIGDIVDMYRQRGYEIVPLETIMSKRQKRALKHEVPSVAFEGSQPDPRSSEADI